MVIEYERIEVRLRDGTMVLGKEYKGEHTARHYVNRAQAEKAAKKENGVVIHRGRPFYVSFSHDLNPSPPTGVTRCNDCNHDCGPEC